MNLHEATDQIRAARLLLDRDYDGVVFDEFAVVQRAGDTEFLLWYEGPRRDQFIQKYGQETAALRAEARSRWTNEYEIGDFEFSPDGEGTKSEAFIVLGDGLALVCGNTTLSMAQISAKRSWLVAQRHFLTLSERFRFDPLVLTENSPGGVELKP